MDDESVRVDVAGVAGAGSVVEGHGHTRALQLGEPDTGGELGGGLLLLTRRGVTDLAGQRGDLPVQLLLPLLEVGVAARLAFDEIGEIGRTLGPEVGVTAGGDRTRDGEEADRGRHQTGHDVGQEPAPVEGPATSANSVPGNHRG